MTTSRRIRSAALVELAHRPTVVIAYPLACTGYAYISRSLAKKQVRTIFVSLRATLKGIVAAHRGRSFTDEEKDRIRIMIAEGYCERPFSDIVVDADRQPFGATVVELHRRLEELGVGFNEGSGNAAGILLAEPKATT